MNRVTVVALLVMNVCLFACNTDGPGTEADRVGVGAMCVVDDDCPQPADDAAPGQVCLQQFDGGYCGIIDCVENNDCPNGSACVTHNDGVNYCFRICLNKSECNLNRGPDVPSNCSANIVFTEPETNVKACVPPSS